MITLTPQLTAAQQALEDRVKRMTLAQLKAVCVALYEAPREDDELVFDACMGRLAGIMSDVEFIEFCESLGD